MFVVVSAIIQNTMLMHIQRHHAGWDQACSRCFRTPSVGQSPSVPKISSGIRISIGSQTQAFYARLDSGHLGQNARRRQATTLEARVDNPLHPCNSRTQGLYHSRWSYRRLRMEASHFATLACPGDAAGRCFTAASKDSHNGCSPDVATYNGKARSASFRT